ncbi:hypothetical protein BJL95_14710 [Methylomonas sp. LWB]|uniref:sensor histidine kinase n=1 Tax=Methylomonas sp. LWB TaxID=1905845 RepID=UPI0008DB30F9|nr:HAMP domain-containing sensor histidine kinase [Methylomonas sp. LWB]OHX35491.1 hypothetical protein BJL95_14710 [Methylomonas sp. LWB]
MRSQTEFSPLNLFALPAGGDFIDLRTRFHQIGVFFWACVIFPPYFIAEQYFSFHTTRYWPILLPLYGLVCLAPLVYLATQSLKCYAAYTVTIGVGLVFVIMACAGGNESPGAFWLAGTPWVFGLFYGVRGVWVGAFVMAVTFATFVGANHIGILPNLVAEAGSYEQVKLINLVGFGIYNILISHYFIRLEASAKRELHKQRQETENLLRILVHDVANPINAIQLMNQAAKTGRYDAEQIMALVDNALGELTSIIQQVRKLRALKDGKLALELAPASMRRMLLETLALMDEQARQKQLAFETEIGDAPAEVLVDAALMKNVVIANLVGNAIKFSRPGQTVAITLLQSRDTVTLTVADRGIGMPQSLLGNLFNPCESTTRLGTAGEPGTGYGMPLAKTILSKLNGEIDVVSRQDPADSGTTVTIRLPSWSPADSHRH